jgi:4-hydroxy-tetrahydrodipicolinate synthase
MDATRRDALGFAAAAAGTLMVGAGSARAADRDLGSPVKTLFWVAALTPCDKSLAFDPGAFRDMLAWFKHKGADGIVVLGTTGEFPSFSMAERKQVAEVALKDKLGMNIIVNPGTPNFPETLELSKHSADHGADGLLVIPPFYYDNPETEGLTRYFSMLFDQVRIPISLYHIPGTSQVPISIALLQSLHHYPNLAGIKDSTGDPVGYAKFLAAMPDLNMRTGTGNNLELALGHGMGAILAEGNVFTEECAAVFAAYRAGKDIAPPLMRLRSSEKLINPYMGYSFGRMKYALNLRMGGPLTYARPPYLDATEAQMAGMREAMAKIKDMG